MPTIEERVAFIEGQVREQAQTLSDVRDAVRQLQGQVHHLVEDVHGLVTRGEFARLDEKMDRQFLWLVGIQITTLAAIVGSIVGALVALAPR